MENNDFDSENTLNFNSIINLLQQLENKMDKLEKDILKNESESENETKSQEKEPEEMWRRLAFEMPEDLQSKLNEQKNENEKEKCEIVFPTLWTDICKNSFPQVPELCWSEISSGHLLNGCLRCNHLKLCQMKKEVIETSVELHKKWFELKHKILMYEGIREKLNDFKERKLSKMHTEHCEQQSKKLRNAMVANQKCSDFQCENDIVTIGGMCNHGYCAIHANLPWYTMINVVNEQEELESEQQQVEKPGKTGKMQKSVTLKKKIVPRCPICKSEWMSNIQNQTLGGPETPEQLSAKTMPFLRLHHWDPIYDEIIEAMKS
jgi:hypothetical protein